jgi:SAM-dependent methyltransferase
MEETAAPLDHPHTWSMPEREDKPELLDMGAGTAGDARASLADMWRVNRLTGGVRALTQHLYPRLQAHDGPAAIGDIGTGAANIPMTIATWAQHKNIPVRIFALDIAARHLEIARANAANFANIYPIQASAYALPFGRNDVDYLVSSLFLHHLAPEQLVDFLRQAYDRVRRALILTDAVRGRLPLVAFKLGQPVFARSYLTRYDGAVSIRRAYTPDELLKLAHAAGLSQARVHQHWLWRMTLVVDK